MLKTGVGPRERDAIIDSPFGKEREPVPTLVIEFDGDTRTYVMDRSGATHRIDGRCGHYAPKGTCRHKCYGEAEET